MPDKVHVLTMPKKGRCLFATRTIHVGEEIVTCPVVVITSDEALTVRRTVLGRYVFDWPGATTSDHWNRVAIALGDVSLVNHSDHPNAVWEALADKDKIRLVAAKGIDAGHEVTIDYQWPQSMTRDFIEQGQRA